MASSTEKLEVNTNYPELQNRVCPYDPNHVVLSFRFASHVRKCYLRHRKEQASKNEEPLFSVCRFDFTHHVRKEELEAHEAICSGQNFNDD